MINVFFKYECNFIKKGEKKSHLLGIKKIKKNSLILDDQFLCKTNSNSVTFQDINSIRKL